VYLCLEEMELVPLRGVGQVVVGVSVEVELAAAGWEAIDPALGREEIVFAPVVALGLRIKLVSPAIT